VTVSPLGVQVFSASGGSGGPYTWSVTTNASSASMSSIGVYTAGTMGNVTDVVTVTDSSGSTATADVKVTAYTTPPGGDGGGVSPPDLSMPPPPDLAAADMGNGNNQGCSVGGDSATWDVSLLALLFLAALSRRRFVS
jgi:MYXO-CTERM domain-containing protein